MRFSNITIITYTLEIMTENGQQMASSELITIFFLTF